MPITTLLQEAGKFEIEVYKKHKNLEALKKTHVPFSGAPLKHPDDPEKIILVADPYSTHTFYYEFIREDISCMEELPSIVNMDGESIPMARVWVKKRSVGIRCSPFLVEDIRII